MYTRSRTTVQRVLSEFIDNDSPFHRVFFENQRGQTVWVPDVWTADTPLERYQGLSGTETLPADTGLLFVYDREAANRAIMMGEMDTRSTSSLSTGLGPSRRFVSPVIAGWHIPRAELDPSM